ncbi:unnamed protein product [Ixodes persulcatus]
MCIFKIGAFWAGLDLWTDTSRSTPPPFPPPKKNKSADLPRKSNRILSVKGFCADASPIFQAGDTTVERSGQHPSATHRVQASPRHDEGGVTFGILERCRRFVKGVEGDFINERWTS